MTRLKEGFSFGFLFPLEHGKMKFVIVNLVGSVILFLCVEYRAWFLEFWNNLIQFTWCEQNYISFCNLSNNFFIASHPTWIFKGRNYQRWETKLINCSFTSVFITVLFVSLWTGCPFNSVWWTTGTWFYLSDCLKWKDVGNLNTTLMITMLYCLIGSEISCADHHCWRCGHITV